MAPFPGGSAWAMVRDIADGYVAVNERTFRSLRPPELDKLSFELDRRLRDVRSEQPSLEDIPALQLKNRKLQRLRSTRMIMQAFRTKMKR